MQPSQLVVPIVGFAIVCGLFHPWMPPVIIFAWPIMGDLVFGYAPLVLLASSLLFATFCLIVAGLPAALFERLTGRRESDATSLWIWLAGMALIALPAFGNLFTFGF